MQVQILNSLAFLMNSFKISNISNHYKYDYVICQEEQIWKIPSYPCIFWNLMPQCPVKVTNILWTCVWSSCYSCYALILHLQTLESGSSRSFMPVEQTVAWKGDISRGTMGIIPGLYVTVADNAANKYLIPNHLAINPILVSSLPIFIHMIISSSMDTLLVLCV